MIYYILGEPEFETSGWYKQIIFGLMAEKRAKRLSVVTAKTTNELISKNIHESDVLLVIGSDEKWISDAVSVCEQKFSNRIIVLGNFMRRFSDKKFSVVSGDIINDISLLYNYFKHYGKQRIALYGVNPNSASDTWRKNTFLSICDGNEKDIYYNTGSLSECFECFSKSDIEYDGIICVNDYTAISLISHSNNKELFVASCSGTQLAALHTPTITNLKTNYIKFGAACTDLCKTLTKNNYVTSIDMYLSSTLYIGKTTNNLPLPNDLSYDIYVYKKQDAFYNDDEIKQMINIEKLLISCTDEDFRIIERILHNATYSELSEEFFMSVSGIKYKLKKMFDACNVTTKTAFADLLKNYIKY